MATSIKWLEGQEERIVVAVYSKPLWTTEAASNNRSMSDATTKANNLAAVIVEMAEYLSVSNFLKKFASQNLSSLRILHGKSVNSSRWSCLNM
jgi:hypothetical protein